MAISGHWRKPNHFKHCLVTEYQNSTEMLQFGELSSRNKGPSFHNLTFFINAFTLAPLNGILIDIS